MNIMNAEPIKNYTQKCNINVGNPCLIPSNFLLHLLFLQRVYTSPPEKLKLRKEGGKRKK